MKVSLCIRSDAETNSGGDWIQLQKTAHALRKLGVDVEVCVGRPPTAPDIVHAFNLTRLTNSMLIARWCRQHGVPLVISPIWHPLHDMARFYGERYSFPYRPFPICSYLALKEAFYERNLKAVTLLSTLFWKATLRYVLTTASLLLPNSPQEYQQLELDLGIETPPSQVVPNAVDLGESFSGCEEREPTIVCPGRIEPRKNQLRVVEAFLSNKSLRDWKLVLLGADSRRHRRYCLRIRRLADGEHVVRADHISYREAQKLYARCSILVLASHFETTGLVGLEGLYQGCNVVMTRRSYSEYYYGPRVEYCDPCSVPSISAAIERAMHRPRPSRDMDYFRRFSWDRVGELTLASYQSLRAGSRT